MDARVWHQVGLELGKINIESTIESQRSSDGRHNLTNKPVQVGVCWSFDVQISTTDVVDGFVVDHEGTVGVLEGGVRGQDRVVGLDNGGRHLRRWVDSKLQFALLSVVHTQSLQEKRSESRSSTSTEGVED